MCTYVVTDMALAASRKRGPSSEPEQNLGFAPAPNSWVIKRLCIALVSTLYGMLCKKNIEGASVPCLDGSGHLCRAVGSGAHLLRQLEVGRQVHSLLASFWQSYVLSLRNYTPYNIYWRPSASLRGLVNRAPTVEIWLHRDDSLCLLYR